MRNQDANSEIDWDERHPLPGGATISLREFMTLCGEFGGVKSDVAIKACLAWYAMLLHATVRPDFKPPTLEETIRRAIAESERTSQ